MLCRPSAMRGLGQETINHHIRAVKAFSRWLWKDGRAREHHLAHLSTASPEADRRRRRRALTPDEAARLVLAAERGQMVKGMSGPDRATLYALALGTGFRASELASLTPERFDLAADPPTVTVLACYSKNGKEAVQPIPPPLADRLPPGWPVRSREASVRGTAKRAARPRCSASIWKPPGSHTRRPRGSVDFHALRATTSHTSWRPARRSRRARSWPGIRPRA